MSYRVWGWGDPADEPTPADLVALAPYVTDATGVAVQEPQVPSGVPALPPSRHLASARRGSEVAQWDEVKAAASEALIAAGGTITHHHAVGRDHRPWYDRQRPDPFALALAGAKAAVDPAGILNPGVLLPAR